MKMRASCGKEGGLNFAKRKNRADKGSGNPPVFQNRFYMPERDSMLDIPTERDKINPV